MVAIANLFDEISTTYFENCVEHNNDKTEHRFGELQNQLIILILVTVVINIHVICDCREFVTVALIKPISFLLHGLWLILQSKLFE